MKTETLEVLPVGNIPLNHDFTEVTRTDLRRAELVILPVVVVLLLLVFGSVVAALLPLAVGALSMAGAIAATLLMARYTSVSVYAPNIVTMIGLGVAIDYSLFIVSRFRQEIREHARPGGARAHDGHRRAAPSSSPGSPSRSGCSAWSSSGSATSARSAGPAPWSSRWPCSTRSRSCPRCWRCSGRGSTRSGCRSSTPSAASTGRGIWHQIAVTVMAHPWAVFISVSALLLFLGLPFLHLKVGSGDVNALPPEAVSRRGDEVLREHFPGADSNRILVVVRYPGRHPADRGARRRSSTISAAGSPRGPTWRGWRAWWISIRA